MPYDESGQFAPQVNTDPSALGSMARGMENMQAIGQIQKQRAEVDRQRAEHILTLMIQNAGGDPTAVLQTDQGRKLAVMAGMDPDLLAQGAEARPENRLRKAMGTAMDTAEASGKPFGAKEAGNIFLREGNPEKALPLLRSEYGKETVSAQTLFKAREAFNAALMPHYLRLISVAGGGYTPDQAIAQLQPLADAWKADHPNVPDNFVSTFLLGLTDATNRPLAEPAKGAPTVGSTQSPTIVISKAQEAARQKTREKVAATGAASLDLRATTTEDKGARRSVADAKWLWEQANKKIVAAAKGIQAAKENEQLRGATPETTKGMQGFLKDMKDAQDQQALVKKRFPALFLMNVGQPGPPFTHEDYLARNPASGPPAQ